MTKLILADGTELVGQPFGAATDAEGEIVFTTGMAGYPESLTDPSFAGQILTFTYPLIGNYGVPSSEVNQWGFSKNLESQAVHPVAVVVAQASVQASHFTAVHSLSDWLAHEGVPGITGIDTRLLTKKIREHGVMPARLVQDNSVTALPQLPVVTNAVATVSCTDVQTYEPTEGLNESGKPVATIVVIDCGAKNNIFRSLLKRGVTVVRVPWNYSLAESALQFDAVLISNGPGDPIDCAPTVAQIKWAIEQGIPTFGICLGNQLVALAIGMQTKKLPYGHRGNNQPCIEQSTNGTPTKRCLITSQNHGYAVEQGALPDDWYIWWKNGNDDTVEGIRHRKKPIYSVQFHPEASPGPEDANYLFDEFLADVLAAK